MLTSLIDRLENDLERNGEVSVADPELANLLYRRLQSAGVSGVVLETTVRLPEPIPEPGGLMKDRTMLFILFVGVLLTAGILLGHLATSTVMSEVASMAVLP